MLNKCGTMLSEIHFSNMPVLLKGAGYDYFILDCEHGGYDYYTASQIIMTAKLCKIECIIRIADNTRKDIIKFMDMGATGLLLPMTNCAEDIKKVVDYAKYAPIGKRGISTMRAHTLYNPPKLSQYMEQANAETKVFAQIETVAGVENIESILSVNGVYGCFLGPNDLSCDYGCIDDDKAPQILSAIDTAAAVSQKLHKKSGIITSNEVYINKAKASNVDYYCVGSELSMLKSAAKAALKKLKE